jgi:ELWxxDGT repeat protein
MDLSYQTVAITAEENSDYIPVSGKLHFLPGEKRKYLSVMIAGDTEPETDETFSLQVGDASVLVTIIDDDQGTGGTDSDPVLSISLLDATGTEISEVEETDANQTLTVRFTLSSATTQSETSFHYTTDLPENNVSRNDTLYPSYNSMVEVLEGDVVFESGEISKDLNITILGDLVNESDRPFILRLSDAVNVVLNDQNLSDDSGIRDVVVPIIDDDPLPEVSFEDNATRLYEGAQTQIGVLLSTYSYQTVEVNLTVSTESTAEASSDPDINDYNVSTLQLLIPATVPNATTVSLRAVVDLNASKDSIDEGNETVILDINSTVNALVSQENNRTTVIIEEPASIVLGLVDQFIFTDLSESTSGMEPWMSDGTVAKTSMLKDIAQDGNSSDPHHFLKAGGVLYFTAHDETGYQEVLFSSDGTADNTVAVYQPSDVIFDTLFNVNEELYFTQMSTDASTGESVIDLYRYDVQMAQAEYLARIKSGYPDGNTIPAVMGNALYFSTDTDEEYDVELYKYDIDLGIYEQVKEINASGSADPGYLTPVGEILYFTANNGAQLWKSQGEENNTVQVTALGTLADSYYSGLHPLNETLYLAVTYYTSNGSTDAGLIALDLTTETASSEILHYADSNLDDARMVTMNGSVYVLILGNSSSVENELVEISGTSIAQTITLSERPWAIKVVDDKLYLQYDTRLDVLTDNGFVTLKTVDSAGMLSWLEDDSVGGYLFFKIEDYNTGTNELWRTDGTVGGTQQLK